MTLLTVEELRLHETSALPDAALQLLLDASEGLITGRFGAIDYAVDTVDGGQTYIFLRRRAATIVSIKEHVGTEDTVLDPDDFRLRDDGVSVQRLATGPNPGIWWGSFMTVAYAPLDDENQYKTLQLKLMKLDLDFVPGNATSEQVASWSESRNAGASFDYTTERDKILESLLATAGPGFA